MYIQLYYTLKEKKFKWENQNFIGWDCYPSMNCSKNLENYTTTQNTFYKY